MDVGGLLQQLVDAGMDIDVEVTVAKFDGDDQTQPPVETLTLLNGEVIEHIKDGQVLVAREA